MLWLVLCTVHVHVKETLCNPVDKSNLETCKHNDLVLFVSLPDNDYTREQSREGKLGNIYWR